MEQYRVLIDVFVINMASKTLTLEYEDITLTKDIINNAVLEYVEESNIKPEDVFVSYTVQKKEGDRFKNKFARTYFLKESRA